jgi:hypothetical protein
MATNKVCSNPIHNRSGRVVFVDRHDLLEPSRACTDGVVARGNSLAFVDNFIRDMVYKNHLDDLTHFK